MPYAKYLLAIGFVAVIGVGAFLLFALRSSSVPALPTSTPPQTAQQPSNTPLPTQPAVPSPQTQTASPSTFATSFYGWYLQGLAGNQAFTTSSAFTSESGNWLTPAFSSKWSSIAQDSGADPALLSQDYAPSWLSSISATVISQTSSTAVIRVSLGNAADLHQVDAHLVSSGASWRIDSVTVPN